MAKYWIGVASEDHVCKAVRGGFCQVNHGKEAPLTRLSRGDGIIYYSPREKMRSGKALKSFTAIGTVVDDKPYEANQSEGFKPFRRKVRYRKKASAEIAPLLEGLSFTEGRKTWGLAMRRGLFEIRHRDFDLISRTMKA